MADSARRSHIVTMLQSGARRRTVATMATIVPVGNEAKRAKAGIASSAHAGEFTLRLSWA